MICNGRESGCRVVYPPEWIFSKFHLEEIKLRRNEGLLYCEEHECWMRVALTNQAGKARYRKLKAAARKVDGLNKP